MSRRCPSCHAVYDEAIAFCGLDGTVTVHVPEGDEEQDPRLGQRFGEYVVVKRIADGAMGRVYEGRHVATRQKVAIKVLHREVASDRVAVERFKREYETAKEIGAEHIVRVIDFGSTNDGSYFLTMEFLGGEELGGVLRREGGQPMARIVRVLTQVALGLADAHAMGVIHRDLKPDNLFLIETPEGDDVRILDFGSVKLQMETGPKLTAFGTTLGSPYYMSPEQAMGRADVDTRTDVFALAAITYEMLTGKIAFDAPAVAQILMKLINEHPAPIATLRAGTPSSIEDVVDKGLAKDKTARHPDTLTFAGDFLGALGLVPDGAPTDRAVIEAWANRPVAEIEAALATATPRPARAFGAPAPSPGQAPAAPTSGASLPPGELEVAGLSPSKKIPLWVWGLAAGAALLFVVVLLIIAAWSGVFTAG